MNLVHFFFKVLNCIFLFNGQKTWITSTKMSSPPSPDLTLLPAVAHTVWWSESLLRICDYCFTAVILHVGLGWAFSEDYNMMSTYSQMLSKKNKCINRRLCMSLYGSQSVTVSINQVCHVVYIVTTHTSTGHLFQVSSINVLCVPQYSPLGWVLTCQMCKKIVFSTGSHLFTNMHTQYVQLLIRQSCERRCCASRGNQGVQLESAPERKVL